MVRYHTDIGTGVHQHTTDVWTKDSKSKRKCDHCGVKAVYHVQKLSKKGNSVASNVCYVCKEELYSQGKLLDCILI